MQYVEGSISWDRQRDDDGALEPSLWYSRFTTYRLLGVKRSFLAVYNQQREKAGKGATAKTIPSSWQHAARKWEWVNRAEAWDVHEQRELLKQEEQARADMLKRHAEIAQKLQILASKRLEILEKAIQKKPGAISGSVSVTEARLMAKDGIGLERQALGLPEHLLTIATMTDQELIEKYAQLAGIIAGSADDGGSTGGDDS